MELLKAREIAVALCYRLQPFCNQIRIAGSIRRHKVEVKDIEICATPLFVEHTQETLFDKGETTLVIHPEFISVANTLGKIIKGKPTGRYMQIELPEGVNLDLFIPEETDYFRQFCIRTGSADWVTKNVAGGWKKRGWCGSDKGLRKQSDCIEMKTADGKSKWTCVNKNAELPPNWASEEDFLKWLSVKWVAPHQRFIPQYKW